MNPRYLARAAPRLKFPIHLHRPFSTSPLTSADPPPPLPPPQRPQPVPLPSNIARAASRASTRDEGIALAKKMMQGIDRNDYKPVRDYDAHRASIDDVSKTQRAKGLERQMPRLSRWQAGDVYAPHDLGPVEAAKWKQRKRSQRDVFDMLGINPLHEYKVCVCVSFIRGVLSVRYVDVEEVVVFLMILMSKWSA